MAVSVSTQRERRAWSPPEPVPPERTGEEEHRRQVLRFAPRWPVAVEQDPATGTPRVTPLRRTNGAR